MTSKINIYTFITASLIILLPVPGRFAYGLVLVLELNILLLVGTLFKRLMMLFKLENLLPLLTSVLLISLSVLYKQILTFISPLMALTLSYALYMPAVSSFLIGYLYESKPQSLPSELLQNMKKTLAFSLYALFVFFFRDVFGYGTLTFPSSQGLHELLIQKAAEGKVYIGVFWASVPGMLVIIAFSLVVIAFFSRKFLKAGKRDDSLEALQELNLETQVQEEAPDAL